jgi:sugar-specific transcriptional regulator TrmB
MINETLKHTLLTIGLTPSEAEIYLILAKKGELCVSNILKTTSMARGTIQAALSILLVQNLVEYRKSGRLAYYKIGDPNRLMNLYNEKKRQDALFDGQFSQGLENFSSLYRLAENKPGVRFLEGIEGFRTALEDSLTAKETILTIADVEAAFKFAPEVNAEYSKKRAEKNLAKKILVINTPFAREFIKKANDPLVQNKLLDPSMNPFATSVQIYDNKVVYMTLREKNSISVIFEDTDIYKFHKSMFEFMWRMTASVVSSEARPFQTE